MNNKKFNFVSYFFQLVAGVILIIATVPKLMGAPESVALFSQLEIDGTRILIGALELFAAVLLILNYLPQIGALLGFGLMGGAVLAHITKLGIVVDDDGGLLFGLLCAVLISTALVMWFQRHRLPLIGYTIRK